MEWGSLFKEAYKCLKPGGWVQSYETVPRIESDDGTIPKNSALAQWGDLFIAGGLKLKRPFTMIDDGLQAPKIAEVGFVNVKERELKVGC